MYFHQNIPDLISITVLILYQLTYNTVAVEGIVVETIHEQSFVAPGIDVFTTTLLLTIKPSDVGLPVHLHSGPVIGYVVEGEFMLQVDDEDPQIISAGNVYYQRDLSKHVWSANASNSTVCKVVAVIYGRPGQDATIFVKKYKRENWSVALSRAKAKQTDCEP